MELFAHTTESTDTTKWQTLKEHSLNVADMTKKFSDYILNGSDLGYFIGYNHDMGKSSKEFQDKLINNLNNKVEHSTAGREFMDDNWIASLLIMYHHMGLPDLDVVGQTYLNNRLKKNIPDYSSWKNYIEQLKTPKLNIESYMIDKYKDFHICNYIRFLFSSLVDADFLDTEKFMNQDKYRRRNNIYSTTSELQDKLNHFIKENFDKLPKTELNILRTWIREECIKSARLKEQLYSLTVGTGLGKTISSLAFALEKAKLEGKNRIIYVIPYNNIISQTYLILISILEEINVLQHHCNVLYDLDNQRDKKKLLSTENWDCPIVVTTSVQFFESLFSNRISKVRKLHNISNSVIIFDEAQKIPINLIEPCFKLIEDLVTMFSCTCLLCTATQPDYSMIKSLRLKPYPIIKDYSKVNLKRTTLKNLGRLNKDKLVDRMKKDYQCLCVVNSRDTAKDLYNMMDDKENIFFLTNSLSPAHKDTVLEEIRNRLSLTLPCRVISTSLIEAGVDVDFPIAYRELAGIDSVIQTAGRANREGKLRVEDSSLCIFELEEIPYKTKEATVSSQVIELYGIDHPDLVNLYFAYLFNTNRDNFDILNNNEHMIYKPYQRKKSLTEQYKFSSISRNFKMVSNNDIAVFVPFSIDGVTTSDKPEELLEKLKEGKSSKIFYSKIRQFMVQLSMKKVKELISQDKVQRIENVYVLKDKSVYDINTGI